MSSCQLMEFARTRFGVEDTCMRHANRLIDKRCLILLLHWKIDDPPPPQPAWTKLQGVTLMLRGPPRISTAKTQISVSVYRVTTAREWHAGTT